MAVIVMTCNACFNRLLDPFIVFLHSSVFFCLVYFYSVLFLFLHLGYWHQRADVKGSDIPTLQEL